MIDKLMINLIDKQGHLMDKLMIMMIMMIKVLPRKHRFVGRSAFRMCTITFLTIMKCP